MTATCWHRDSVPKIMKVDAGEPDEASNRLFLATHVAQPLRLVTGRQWADLVTGDPASLEELLHRIADSPPDAKLNWIVGDPGTGKSHLVRWLWLRQASEDGLLTRRVVFIPRSDTVSLRRVVDRIIGDEQGPEFDAVRDALSTAVEGYPTPEAARRSLLFELANLIATDYEVAERDRFRPFTDRGWTRGHLDAARQIPAWLLDDEFLRLLVEDGGTAARIADTRLGRRHAAQRDEEDLVFRAIDLPLHPNDVDQAGGRARDLHQSLQDSPDIQAYVLDVLNTHLDRAVQQVFGVARGMVTDAALELRRRLKGRGESLWLYFEDFAVLQGVQQELLDVFVDNAPDLCDLRVVAAVTPGPLRQLPTMVWGRTNVVCDLNVRQEQAIHFRRGLIGRYLNAVRWGEEGLRELPTGAEVRNRCEECPLGIQEECHAGFGSVEVDGLGHVGLYPFNARSLDRAVEQKLGRGGEEVFIPRFVITNVLREFTYSQHRAIENGTFPSRELAREFTPPDERLAQVEVDLLRDRCRNSGIDDEVAVRDISFQQLWGKQRHAFDRFHPVVAKLLGLRFPDGPAEDDEGEDEEDGTDEVVITPTPKPPAEQVPRSVREVRLWAEEEDRELREGDRNELRKALHEHVMAELNLENGHMGPSAWSVRGGFEQTDLVVDGRSERAYNQPVPIPRTPQTAQAFEELAWHLHSSTATASVSPGRLRRRFDTLVDDLAVAVRGATIPAGPTEAARLEAVCRILVVSAAAAGLELRSATPEDCVNTVLLAVPREDEVVDVNWTRLQRVATGETSGSRSPAVDREAVRTYLLKHVAFTQNEGAVQAVDFDRLIAPARVALEDFGLPDENDVPTAVRPFLEQLQRGLAQALPKALDAAASWWSAVRPHLGGAETAAELASALQASIIRARQTALLVTGEAARAADQVLTIGERLSGRGHDLPLETVKDIGATIEKALTGPERDQLEALRLYHRNLQRLNALRSLITEAQTALAAAEATALGNLDRKGVKASDLEGPPAEAKGAVQAIQALKREFE